MTTSDSYFARTAVTLASWCALAGVAAAADTPALIEAVKAGRAEVVRALLADPSDVAARDADGTTALHWAVRADETGIVQMLLDAGADPGAATRPGVTPLMLAVRRGDWPMVRLLLRRNAAADRIVAGQSLVADAVLNGYFAIAHELLQAGADYHAGSFSGADAATLLHQRDMAALQLGEGQLTALSPLVTALDAQDRAALNALFAETDYQEPDPFGPYPLYLSALFDDVTSLRAMIEQGAHADHSGALGSPPLIAAVMMGRLDVTAALLAGIEVRSESWLWFRSCAGRRSRPASRGCRSPAPAGRGPRRPRGRSARSH